MMKYLAAAISGLSSATSLIASDFESPVCSETASLIALMSYAVFAVLAAKATRELSRA